MAHEGSFSVTVTCKTTSVNTRDVHVLPVNEQ